MHAVFMMTGIKRDMDEVIKFLETRTMNLPVTDKEGNTQNVKIQGQLRPVQLFEYVFPEEEKDAVLNTLKFDEKAYPQYKSLRPMLAGLRKLLRVKKTPKFKKDKLFSMPEYALQHVSIIPVGVRYADKREVTPGLYHEAL